MFTILNYYYPYSRSSTAKRTENYWEKFGNVDSVQGNTRLSAVRYIAVSYAVPRLVFSSASGSGVYGTVSCGIPFSMNIPNLIPPYPLFEMCYPTIIAMLMHGQTRLLLLISTRPWANQQYKLGNYWTRHIYGWELLFLLL